MKKKTTKHSHKVTKKRKLAKCKVRTSNQNGYVVVAKPSTPSFSKNMIDKMMMAPNRLK